MRYDALVRSVLYQPPLMAKRQILFKTSYEG